MNILFKSAYIVDHENSKIEFKDIDTKDLRNYVLNLLVNINQSTSISDYKVRDNGTTQIMNQCKLLIADSLFEKDQTRGTDYTQIMANRFLEKEKKAQEIVLKLGKKIKVGCLIIALILYHEKYQLLIAKLDSLSGLELVEFKHKDIIEDNEKKFGKTCLIDICCNEETIEIERIRVLLDNKAKYFTEEFLEIDPLCCDDICTEKSITSVLTLVDSELRKDHPKERQLIRNSFIMYMRTNEFIDYNDVVEEVFTNYFNSEFCEIPKDKREKISKKLEALPEKKNFARQFNRIKDKINVRLVKSEYKLADDLDLVIHESKMKQFIGNSDIFDRVFSEQDHNGKTYLKIYTDNEETLKTFKKETSK